MDDEFEIIDDSEVFTEPIKESKTEVEEIFAEPKKAIKIDDVFKANEIKKKKPKKALQFLLSALMWTAWILFVVIVVYLFISYEDVINEFVKKIF